MTPSFALQILSDLHLESPAQYETFEIDPQCDNLALLGDIGNVKDEGLFVFLTRQLQNFRMVFFILGNHEPYDSSWSAAKKRLIEFQQEFSSKGGRGKFVILDRTRIDVSSSVTVLGCTLFSKILPAQMERVSFGMNDFYYIADWSVEKHVNEHQGDLDWLNAQVRQISGEDPAREIVILTHYCPTTHDVALDPKHRESPILSGFCTDLKEQECWTNSKVALWVYGHTHYNCDFRDAGGKRVLSNQRGYYHMQAHGFQANAVIHL